MRIEITCKPVEVTDLIRQRIESRFDKLVRHDVPIISSHVAINREGQEYQVEAKANIASGQLVATGYHEDLYAAINQMGQKLERQMTAMQAKESSRRHDRTNAVKAQ